MAVKLKVLHGALKKNDRLQLVVPIRKTPFVVGRAEDCDMRCHSQAISRHHCEIRVSGFDVTIVDLNSRNGVQVNGERVLEQQRLMHGDRLAIGKLEFAVIIELPKRQAGRDPLGDSVCDMLVEADQVENAVNDQNPDSRWYQLERATTSDPYEGMTPKEKRVAKARAKIPKQKAPQNLPKRVSDTIHDAIDDTLAKYSNGIDRCYRRPQNQGSESDSELSPADQA